MKKIPLINNIIKTSVLLLILFFNYCPSIAQWQWANHGGSINWYDGASSVCVDLNGNTYISGSIQGPIAYFNSDTIQINGINDMFIAKYNSNGIEQWVKVFGGNYNNTFSPIFENAQSIVYWNNAIYVIGHYVGSFNIDSYTLVPSTLSENEGYLAKLDLNGNCVWAKSFGSVGNDFGNSLSVNMNGIYITGMTPYTAQFDSIIIAKGGYLALYDDNGNCQWAKHIFNGENNIWGTSAGPHSLQIHNNDLFIAALKVSDSVTVDTIQIIKPNNNGSILARFNSLGNVIWAKLIGGPSAEFGNLSLDINGNCYFTSRFFNGSAEFENDTLFAAGTTDFFFTKYDINGAFQLVRQSNASINARGIGTSVDANGNIYLTGNYEGSASFGSFQVASGLTPDLFLARYDSNGNCLGIRIADNGIGYCAQTTPTGGCVVAGVFDNTISLGSTTLNSYGVRDAFVALSDIITDVGEGLKNAMNDLFIYSNPNAGKFTITIPEDFQNETSVLMQLFDGMGKLVKQISLQPQSRHTLAIDLQDVSKGYYSISLSNKEISFSGKLIIE